mgnify:CR=1 FL=1
MSKIKTRTKKAPSKLVITKENKNSKKTIGIAGVGIVGTQIKDWFELKGHNVFTYDKFNDNFNSFDELNEAEIIFLCLPTPHSKNYRHGVNLSDFDEILRKLNEPKLIIIKSTVPVGATHRFQKIFTNHYFFHNPEFLTATRARKDFFKPIYQIIGYTEKSKRLSQGILRMLPKGKKNLILPARSSEIFKFTRNAFFTVKVIFANHIYDLCQSFGEDYEKIKDLMHADPWMSRHHFHVMHNDYRGFGGKCLPKDLKTYIKIFKSRKLKPELFEVIDKINTQLLKEQNLFKTLKEKWLNNKGA